jgi:hypothetical protein
MSVIQQKFLEDKDIQKVAKIMLLSLAELFEDLYIRIAPHDVVPGGP